MTTMPSIAQLWAKLEAAAASAGVAMMSERPHHEPEAQDEPGSAVGGRSPERAARPFVLTMVTAIRPGGQRLLRGFFSTVRQRPAIQKPLIDMAVIRAAYWTVVEKLPNGNFEPEEELRPAYLLFESTYDTNLANYIDMFARDLPWQMRAIWGTGYGYPGVLPSSAFNRWVDDHRYVPDHSWMAYPEATTRMVASGLRVAERLEAFNAEIADCDDDDEEFAFRFNRLLVELQRDL